LIGGYRKQELLTTDGRINTDGEFNGGNQPRMDPKGHELVSHEKAQKPGLWQKNGGRNILGGWQNHGEQNHKDKRNGFTGFDENG